MNYERAKIIARGNFKDTFVWEKIDRGTSTSRATTSKEICDALCDWVPYVQFEKHEKYP